MSLYGTIIATQAASESVVVLVVVVVRVALLVLVLVAVLVAVLARGLLFCWSIRLAADPTMSPSADVGSALLTVAVVPVVEVPVAC